MARNCTNVFSHAYNHHFHKATFIRSCKCGVRFYAIYHNDVMRGGGKCINIDALSRFCFADNNCFHSRFDWCADTRFSYAVKSTP